MLSFFSRVGHRFVSAVKRHRTPKRIVAILAEFKGNSWTLEGLCVLQINDAGTSNVLQVSPYSIIDSSHILHLPRFEEEFSVPINDCTTFSKIQNRLVICQAFRSGFVDYGFFFFTDHDCVQFWDRISAAEDHFTEMNPPPCSEMKTPAPFSSPLQRTAVLNVLPHEARSYCLMASSVNHQFTPEKFAGTRTRTRRNTHSHSSDGTSSTSSSQSSSNSHSTSSHSNSHSHSQSYSSAPNSNDDFGSATQTSSNNSSSSSSANSSDGTNSGANPSHTSPPPVSNIASQSTHSPTYTASALSPRSDSNDSRHNRRASMSSPNSHSQSQSHSMFVLGNSFPEQPSQRREQRRGTAVPRCSRRRRPVEASPLSTKLTVSAALRFPSIRADVAITEGKWYYEVELRTNELMQIGWASCHSFYPKVRGFGVGDDEFSWSFDGYRQLRWGLDASTFSSVNSASDPSAYGTDHRPWRAGDRVGVSIDLRSQPNNIAFYVNGVSLGPAFEDFDIAPNRSSTSSRGHGYGVSPAVSLSDHQSLTFVFERDFLKHLPSGYEPLQDVRGELRSCLLAFSEVADDVASIIIDFCPI